MPEARTSIENLERRAWHDWRRNNDDFECRRCGVIYSENLKHYRPCPPYPDPATASPEAGLSASQEAGTTS